MQVEGGQAATIEKQETRLLGEYQDTLQLLYRGNIEEGVGRLKGLLENPIIGSREFDGLRYSVLQSLTELSEKHSNTLDEAIYYLHQAIQIREDFLLWRRLSGLCRRRGYLDQAHYSIKKSLGLAPTLSKEIVLYELCQIVLLREDYKLALQVIEELLQRHFRIDKIKALKVYCLSRMLDCSWLNTKDLHLQNQLKELMSQGTPSQVGLDEQRDRLKKLPPYPVRNASESVAAPCLILTVSASTTWPVFLTELCLLLKYSLEREQDKERKKKSVKVYRGLEEFFAGKDYMRMAVRIVASRPAEEGDKPPIPTDGERLLSLSEAYLAAKRKRNRESGHTLKVNCDGERQYLRITGNINVKDYLTNQAVHLNSLVHILAKHRRKDMSKLKIMKALNEELYPQEDFFSEILKFYTEELTAVLVLDTDRNNSTVPVEEEDEEEPPIPPGPAIDSSEDPFRDLMKKDFQEFLAGIGEGCLVNVIELAHRVVNHFVENKERGLREAAVCWKEPSRGSLRITPHYLLKSSEDGEIKYLVTKLYLRSLKLSCGNMYTNPASKLTLLELTVDRCIEMSNRLGQKNKDRLQSQRKKRTVLREIILGLEADLFLKPDFGTFMSNWDQLTKTCLRLRAYHSLGIFFSLAEHESKTMVEKILPKFSKYQEEYCKATGGDRSINVFWLDTGTTKADLSEYLQTRLRENKLQSEIEHLDVSEEIGTVLRNSIENFRKAKDKSMAEAIELYYKNIVEMMSDDKLPFPIYLTYLAELLGIYLEILERKPAKEDHARYIAKIDELIKDDDLALHLIRRTNQEKELQGGACVRLFLQLSHLFIRILLTKYLVMDSENSSHMMKGLLCSLTYLIRGLNTEQRLRFVPDIVLLIHMMAHVPAENLSLHKKVNTHFMARYIEYLYEDKRIQDADDETSHHGDDPEEPELDGPEVIEVEDVSPTSEENEHTSFRSEAEEALKCFYGFSQKKLGEFVPTTYKDVENFTKYLKLFYPQYFEKPSFRIKLPINNILKASEKILHESKALFCAGLDEARKKVCGLYDGSKRDDPFYGKLSLCLEGQSQSLCDCQQPNCFDRIKSTQPALIDTYYIVAKSLENEDLTDEVNKTDVERAFRHAEKLYQMVVCFDVLLGRSWYSLFKINKKKAFVYFDSLIYEEPLNDWKNAFLAAKKIAVLMKERPNMLSVELRNELEEDLFILNLLKIYERKFLYMQSKEATPPSLEDTKNKELKLVDAFTTIISKLESPARTLRIEYLSLIYLLKPYYLKCSFNSGNCARVLVGLVNLRQSLKADAESDEPFRISDEQLYPEILFLVYKVIVRYMEMIKLADPVSARAVLTDLGRFLAVLRTQGLNLLDEVIKTEADYFENYYNRARDQFEPERNSEYLSMMKEIVAECGGRDEVPPDIKDQINTVVSNLKAQLRTAMTVKNASKKTRLMRYFTSCCYCLSKIELRFENDKEKAVKTMGELVNIKFDDIIQIYRFYENQSLERDAKLSEFFNRNLFFMMTKYKYIRYVIQLYFEVSDYDKIRQLHKKLNKLIPRDESHRVNQVFVLLHRICLEYSLNSLWEMLVSKNHLDDFERWLLELYDKIIRPKKSPKNTFTDNIRQLFAGYYVAREREANPHSEIPENGRFERGLAMLEEKHKKRKLKEGQPEAK